mmetsp:Transcript_13365/g.21969  ORF Transcript_13365/g.21969 Transcript_13365/m.21969 type:complete len:117 (-) Transcript_13365:19-369(-)
MGVLVKIRINGREPNKGGLLSLNHGEPYDGEDTNDEGGPWTGVGGELCISGEHQSDDEHDGENEENHGVCVPEDGEGGELHIVGVGMALLFVEFSVGHGCVDFISSILLSTLMKRL